LAGCFIALKFCQNFGRVHQKHSPVKWPNRALARPIFLQYCG
jgi:hypothetical protein